MGISFFILKPDAVEKGLTEDIVQMIEADGMVVRELRRHRYTKEQAEDHYRDHAGKPYFAPMVEFLASGPCWVGCVEAAGLHTDDVVPKLRTLVGPYADPTRATIRGRFGVGGSFRNLVHSSDSRHAVLREMQVIQDRFRPLVLVEGPPPRVVHVHKAPDAQLYASTSEGQDFHRSPICRSPEFAVGSLVLSKPDLFNAVFQDRDDLLRQFKAAQARTAMALAEDARFVVSVEVRAGVSEAFAAEQDAVVAERFGPDRDADAELAQFGLEASGGAD